MISVLDRWLLAAVDRRVKRKFHWLVSREDALEPPPGHRAIAYPKTANDKFLWRKIYDHDPRFTILSDKLKAKAWVRARRPDLAMPKTLWVGLDPAQMDADLWQRPLVLKPTHSCKMNVFYVPGQTDRDAAIAEAKGYLSRRHGVFRHETGYFGVRPRLFAEERVGVPGRPLDELKIYTHGRVIERVIFLRDRFGDAGGFAGSRWLPGADGVIRRSGTKADVSDVDLPDDLPPVTEAALAAARTLGEEFDQMRVDFLTDGETLWFGEMTCYTMGGTITWTGHDPDSLASRAWDLRGTWFLRYPGHGLTTRIYAGALRRQLARDAGDGHPPIPEVDRVDRSPWAEAQSLPRQT